MEVDGLDEVLGHSRLARTGGSLIYFEHDRILVRRL